MEVAGVIQEVLRVLTHAPSGKPSFLTSAIRRSIVVGFMGARAFGISKITLFTALAGSIALFMALARGILETRGISDNQIGHLPCLVLQIFFAGILLAASATLSRRILPLI